MSVGWTALLMFDTWQKSCDVPLCAELEGLHFCMELWSGGYVDTIVDLEVQEFGALSLPDAFSWVLVSNMY